MTNFDNTSAPEIPDKRRKLSDAAFEEAETAMEAGKTQREVAAQHDVTPRTLRRRRAQRKGSGDADEAQPDRDGRTRRTGKRKGDLDDDLAQALDLGEYSKETALRHQAGRDWVKTIVTDVEIRDEDRVKLDRVAKDMLRPVTVTLTKLVDR
jgi:transposase-like protein